MTDIPIPAASAMAAVAACEALSGPVTPEKAARVAIAAALNAWPEMTVNRIGVLLPLPPQEASDDHERGCQGRYYDCSCGYDGKRDPLLDEAADRIEQLEAALREAADELDAYYRAEYPGGHPYSQKKLTEAMASNPARAALKNK